MIRKKICLVGSVAVGKTSMVRRFVHGIFSDDYLTTIGVKVDKKELRVGGRDLSLIVWDLSGEDEFAPFQTRYLRGASGYILVIDGTRLATLESALELQRKTEAALGSVPFIVAINKADLEREWQLGTGQLEALRERGWPLRTTSAKTGSGVEEIFVEMGEQLAPERPPAFDDLS